MHLDPCQVLESNHRLNLEVRPILFVYLVLEGKRQQMKKSMTIKVEESEKQAWSAAAVRSRIDGIGMSLTTWIRSRLNRAAAAEKIRTEERLTSSYLQDKE